MKVNEIKSLTESDIHGCQSGKYIKAREWNHICINMSDFLQSILKGKALESCTMQLKHLH